MKKILVVFLIFVCSCVYGNDGVYFMNGNQLVPDHRESDISVKKEILTISLQDNGMTKVNVYYEFNNKRKTPKKIIMGFEANPPYNSNAKFSSKGIHPFISDFSVKMNGKVLPYSNAVVENMLPQGFKKLDLNSWKAEGSIFDDSCGTALQHGDKVKHFSYAYYFEAEFEPGINRVLHSYNYNTSYSVGRAFVIDYKLSPAIRWANKKIDDFTLVIRADNTAKQFCVNYDLFKKSEFKLIKGIGKFRKAKRYDEDCIEFTLRNGAFMWQTTNFKPAQELRITSCEDLYFPKSEKETMKLGCAYDRNSHFLWISGINSDFEVKVAHNLPYAHRGYVFTDPEMKKYFEQMWWYMPDENYKQNTDDFTEKDWEYVNKKKGEQ